MIDVDKDLFYWGCWGRIGHYLWNRHGLTVDKDKVNLPKSILSKIDGDLAPNPGGGKFGGRGPQAEGSAALRYIDEWSVLAFWDRSIDTRGGSNSALLVRADVGLSDMLALGNQHFASVWQRFRFAITLYAPVAPLPYEARIAALEKKLADSEEVARIYFGLLTNSSLGVPAKKEILYVAFAQVRSLEAKLDAINNLAAEVRTLLHSLEPPK